MVTVMTFHKSKLWTCLAGNDWLCSVFQMQCNHCWRWLSRFLAYTICLRSVNEVVINEMQEAYGHMAHLFALSFSCLQEAVHAVPYVLLCILFLDIFACRMMCNMQVQQGSYVCICWLLRLWKHGVCAGSAAVFGWISTAGGSAENRSTYGEICV